MYERMRGVDATYLHFESDRVRAHTLKCLVLDPSRRGRPLTLDEIAAALGPRLSLHPRSRQRAMRARGLPGAVWVDDPAFRLVDHLRERTLAEPGYRSFDQLCSELATEPMDLDRPLWDLTLVNGLDRGHQAAVFRIHHALTDGVGVANMLERFTCAHPGETVPTPSTDRWQPAPLPSERELRRLAWAAAPAYARQAATFGREWWGKRPARRDAAAVIRQRDDLLGRKPGARISWSTPSFGAERLCASGQLPWSDVAKVKDAHGVTVNTVLLTIVGEAVAAESRARGELDAPTEVASFGVAVDPDPDRITGNSITPAFVKVHTDEPDLAVRLVKTARTSADAVEAQRSLLTGRTVRLGDLVARGTPLAVRLADRATNLMAGNFVTANVRGPSANRWLGDVEVVDFISWAILVPPIGVNVTMYTYGDHVSIGLLTSPEVTTDPHHLIEGFRDALDRLVAAS